MGAPCKNDCVVIVDDDESVRRAIQGVLESVGFNASSFASAEEFLSSDAVDRAACLIVDLKMPGMSGVELQQRLVKQGRQIPIIFVSAYGEEKVRTRALSAGAIGFLDKPFNDETLIDIVMRAIGG